ncbi:MAG: hypothetical protein QOF94_2759, partial [Acidobacteriaceae bacterium]
MKPKRWITMATSAAGVCLAILIFTCLATTQETKENVTVDDVDR